MGMRRCLHGGACTEMPAWRCLILWVARIIGPALILWVARMWGAAQGMPANTCPIPTWSRCTCALASFPRLDVVHG